MRGGKSCWEYFKSYFQEQISQEMRNAGLPDSFFDNLIIPPNPSGSAYTGEDIEHFYQTKRPGPVATDHSWINFIEWSPSSLKRSSRKSGHFFDITVRVADEAGTPIPGANLWIVSDDGKHRWGETDREGFIECPAALGIRLEIYFAGSRATLDIDEIKDEYFVTLPIRSENDVPGIIVSAEPDSSDPSRVLVTVSGDTLSAGPQVSLFQSRDHSADVPMTSDGHLWTGMAEYEYDSGLLEITAASESALSQSVASFEVYDAERGTTSEYYSPRGKLNIRCYPDSFSASGTFVITESSAPSPANGDLTRVGYVGSIGFSDDIGAVRNIRFSIMLWPPEQLEGLDASRLTLYGWDAVSRAWHPIPGGRSSLRYFGITLDSADYVSYALFAPRSSDTVPPDPITDFMASTGEARWSVKLQWTAPADNHAVYAYDIRYSATPAKESDWDNCRQISPYDIPRPAEPGISHTITVGIDPDTEYYFAIRSADASGNWSPIASSDTPVKSRIIDNDEDGMSDMWETSNGLDPTTDDSQNDDDDDGLTNIQEYEHRTRPWDADSDNDAYSDSEELELGSDPLNWSSRPYTESVMLQVVDRAGSPIAGADVWRVSEDDLKYFEGRTDREGFVGCSVMFGDRLEAYFAGEKAEYEIQRLPLLGENYTVTMPITGQNDPDSGTPCFIVSARPEGSGLRRILLTVSGDELLFRPEITRSHRRGIPADVTVSSSDSRLWSGVTEYEYLLSGTLEITAVSESGTSRSANPFKIYHHPPDEEGAAYHSPHGGLTMNTAADSFSGSGTFVIMESSAPSPRNGDLVRVGHVLSLGFSDSLGTVRDVEFEMTLPGEQFAGLDAARLNLYGRDTENETWCLIPGGGNDLRKFSIILGSADYVSYALFAPRSDDTLPPDPVTDFQAETGGSERSVVLRWTVPADDHAVYAYDIRFHHTESFPEAYWDERRQTDSAPRPAEPGSVQEIAVETTYLGVNYYFAVRAADAAGNLSPITVLEKPVKSGITDTDGDGMSDDWETRYDLDPNTDDSQNDADRDGLTNLQEYQNYINPRNPDSDDDGYPDGTEMRFGSDPDNVNSRPHGDIDCDSDIDLADVIVALQLQISGETPPELCLSDTDGKIGIDDVIRVLKGLSE